ncbi:GTP cyclohydrolase II-domain-containing protein [Suillus paluster]|uniref:GTP cyclohydrolase II-domain-containing protein n=1 Tax=Suillus paluster TaxID=48578 RepID=UPI001B868DB6|nr:GTP cyclohydrolase II-domain-containing protein [Suillus paluster]KAG1752560.1 GTP cyclohydrolase II-domain-containing protein [Suillus paluster]
MALTESFYPNISSPLLADSDAALLDVLTSPRWQGVQKFSRRDAALDPLLLAVAASAGARTTRNHYQHDFFPGAPAESIGRGKRAAEDTNKPQERKRMSYVSRQGPRRLRLQPAVSPHPATTSEIISLDGPSPTSSIEVKCMARTRIPTPHGPVFLHLYHNNRDNKEHLAIVVDPAQYSDNDSVLAPSIRSRSLDAVWSDDETDMDRIIRGAYVGKLSATSQHPSRPSSHQPPITTSIPSPLVRIHSECFTGETIGSMRCDCGEQLDEAIRLISQPTPLPENASSNSRTMPGRGAIIYLKQEGRGIGLLSKIRAYNLQDLGHDTVTANLMLGHRADERGYEIAVAILRDLGLGSELAEGVRLLTNNPDKVQAIEKEGLRVVERVPMVPRSWRHRSHPEAVAGDVELDAGKAAGVTMIGGEAVRGEDLDKYLRTKILRMGHMLPLYLAGGQAAS